MGGVCPIVLILELSAGAGGGGVGDITIRSLRSCLCDTEGGIITVALVILPANIRINSFFFVSTKAVWTAEAELKPIQNVAFSVNSREYRRNHNQQQRHKSLQHSNLIFHPILQPPEISL